MSLKLADLRAMTDRELRDKLLGLRRDQLRMRVQHAARQLTKTHELRNLRGDVARIKTEFSMRRQRRGVSPEQLAGTSQ